MKQRERGIELERDWLRVCLFLDLAVECLGENGVCSLCQQGVTSVPASLKSFLSDDYLPGSRQRGLFLPGRYNSAS